MSYDISLASALLIFPAVVRLNKVIKRNEFRVVHCPATSRVSEREANKQRTHGRIAKIVTSWMMSESYTRCPTTKCQVTRNSVVCVNACVQDASTKQTRETSYCKSAEILEIITRNFQRRRRTVSDDDADDSGTVVIWQYNCPPVR